MKGHKLTHVAVHGAGEDDSCFRIQLGCTHRGRQGIEVGVLMGSDECIDLEGGCLLLHSPLSIGYTGSTKRAAPPAALAASRSTAS